MISPTRVLVTGFEPFGGETINPSASIAEALSGRRLGPTEIVGRVLPCVFGRSREFVREWVRTLAPTAVICLGQAGGREGIHVERIAINIDDARIPDNAGAQPVDTPIVPGGPAAYWSTLPLKEIVAQLESRGIAATVSQTAGTFVCNHVFYALMHDLAQGSAPHRVRSAGFVHVPWLPEQPSAERGQPSLPLATQIAAVEQVILATVARRGRVEAGGAEH